MKTLTLALILAVQPPALSAVLFDNFASPATGFNRTEYQNDASAMAFVTGASHVLLDSVTIELFSSSSETRSLRVEIFSNNPTASQPAAMVGEFDQLIQVPGSGQNASLAHAAPFTTTTGGILLAANSTFWLVVSGAGSYGNGDGGVFWTLNDGAGYTENANGIATVPGYSSQFSNDGGISWPHSHDWNHTVRFEGVAVPEPATASVAVLSLLLALRRRRRSDPPVGILAQPGTQPARRAA